jgi:hypothetical protein
MPSGSSLVKDALASYVAGRVKAERLVIAVAAAYYGGDGGRGTAAALRPLIDVIDRASPGIVELGTAQSGAGFAIRLVERPFPKQYEAELRRAAELYLVGATGSGMMDGGRVTPGSEPGLLARLVAAVRRLFTASA